MARQRGLSVPDDLSVVGFDDTYVAEWSGPPLTTVHQPLQEMGRAAVRVLLNSGGRLSPGHPPRGAGHAARRTQLDCGASLPNLDEDQMTTPDLDAEPAGVPPTAERAWTDPTVPTAGGSTLCSPR